MAQQSQKVVVLVGGTGFIGRRLSRAIIDETSHKIAYISRKPPSGSIAKLIASHPSRFLPPCSYDISAGVAQGSSCLEETIAKANVVVNLVGILVGDFDAIQLKGAETLVNAVKKHAHDKMRFVQLSAIGANADSTIPYARTKGLAEIKILESLNNACILRPSLVFGKEDNFFNRFETLARYLPLMPVFGDGRTKFQPIWVDDLTSAILKSGLDDQFDHFGKVIEVGGGKVMTYREIIQYVLKRAKLKRAIVPVPWPMALLQASVLEKLPESILSMTRDQVRLLKLDNVVGAERQERGLQIIPGHKAFKTNSWKSPYDLL